MSLEKGSTGNGQDTNALHVNIANEIAGIANKAVVNNNDLLVIEDSQDTNNKKNILISALPTGAGGEINTASNIGVGGVGLFNSKIGVDLQFKNIGVGSTKLIVVNDAVNNRANLDADGGKILDGEIAGNGLVVRSGVETYINRTLAIADAKLVLTNADGSGGNPTLGVDGGKILDGEVAGNGLVVRSGVETYTNRTLSAGSTQITITNGDGVAGNPTINADGGKILDAEIASNGILVRTGAETYTARELFRETICFASIRASLVMNTERIAMSSFYVASTTKKFTNIFLRVITMGAEANATLEAAIYNEAQNTKIIGGTVVVSAIGIATINIADTDLAPGIYWLAVCNQSQNNVELAVNDDAAFSNTANEYGAINYRYTGATALPASNLAGITKTTPEAFSIWAGFSYY